MKIGEKFFLDGFVYEILDKIFKPSSGDMDDEDWHGYQVRNTLTGEVVEFGEYSIEHYAISMAMLEERRKRAIQSLEQAQKEMNNANEAIEKYGKLLL